MLEFRTFISIFPIALLACLLGSSPTFALGKPDVAGNAVPEIIWIASAKKPVTQLKGLADGEGCAFAKGRGTVESVEMGPSGKDIGAFWYNDAKFGRSYVNVSLEGKNANSKVRSALAYLLQPGNVLEIGTYGCGAAARIEMLASVKLLKLGKSK